MASRPRLRPNIDGASTSVSGYWREQHRLDEEQRALDVRRRARYDERHYNEENGFYGR
jgi:hypothetical protein